MKYLYHDRNEDGSYDRETVKELHRAVGTPYEDVPLEKLANVVLAQMARRDIWVVDVEIHEFEKRAVSFKESKGGILLKNRKFMLDSAEIGVAVAEPPAPPVNLAPPANHFSTQSSPPPATTATPIAPREDGGLIPPHALLRPPAEHLVFQPELHHMARLKPMNLKFTIGKKYPVYVRELLPTGGSIITKDDTGRDQRISDIYFVPDAQLAFDDVLHFDEKGSGGTLDLAPPGGWIEDDVLDIRR